jgi:hypothetical protein
LAGFKTDKLRPDKPFTPSSSDSLSLPLSLSLLPKLATCSIDSSRENFRGKEEKIGVRCVVITNALAFESGIEDE